MGGSSKFPPKFYPRFPRINQKVLSHPGALIKSTKIETNNHNEHNVVHVECDFRVDEVRCDLKERHFIFQNYYKLANINYESIFTANKYYSFLMIYRG